MSVLLGVDLKGAADSASNLAKQYKSVLQVVEALNRVGDLDNLHTEIEKQVGKITVDKRDAEQALLVVNLELNNARNELARVKAEAVETAAQASRDAENLIAAATQEGEERRAAVTQELDVVREGQNRDIEVHDALIAGKRKELAALNEQIKAAETGFAELKARLETPTKE